MFSDATINKPPISWKINTHATHYTEELFYLCKCTHCLIICVLFMVYYATSLHCYFLCSGMHALEKESMQDWVTSCHLRIESSRHDINPIETARSAWGSAIMMKLCNQFLK